MAMSVAVNDVPALGKREESMLCRACNGQLQSAECGEYALCDACGSANYVSLRSAEEDNAQYFEEVYSDTTRCPIQKRCKRFETFERIHSLFHADEEKAFRAVLNQMVQSIRTARKAMEVGFGSGHELADFLKSGANIYGVDLSREAVAKFKEAHPKFSDRVSWGSMVSSHVDVLYSNALFEHLDGPSEFLENAGSSLSEGGLLLLRLPVLMQDIRNREVLEWDINCWKPCHRTLYSRRGLEILLGNHGFTIVETAPLAYYGYKVMSSMLRRGYRDVARVRNPYLPIAELESEGQYLLILFESLFRKLICSDYAVVARKER